MSGIIVLECTTNSNFETTCDIVMLYKLGMLVITYMFLRARNLLITLKIRFDVYLTLQSKNRGLAKNYGIFLYILPPFLFFPHYLMRNYKNKVKIKFLAVENI